MTAAGAFTIALVTVALVDFALAEWLERKGKNGNDDRN